MLSTAKSAAKKQWWEPYRHLVPSSLLDYFIDEAEASTIDIFESIHIPGLLQTESYARMALTQAGMYRFDKQAIEDRIKLRMQRQWQVMDQATPPQITVVLDEAALHRHAHGAEILREQLLHLAELAQLPMITLRVIAFDVGLHAGMDTGTISILGKDGAQRTESLFTGEYAHRSNNEVEIFMHKQLFEGLLNKALGTDESLALIRAIAQDL